MRAHWTAKSLQRLQQIHDHIARDQMSAHTIFISYSFTDANAKALCRLARDVATSLRRVTIVDGKTLDLRSNFSGTIASFIRESADCVVGIFTRDQSARPNVLYEVGIAVGADKEVILISEDVDNIPSMLRTYDILTIDRNQLDWQRDFRSLLDRKFRTILQVPDDHLVEDKLARRYQPEELELFNDPTKVQAAIESIRAADLLKAEAILNKALENDSKNLDALFLMADCIYLQGCSTANPAERKELFSRQHATTLRALGIDPKHSLSLNVKARAELRLGDFGAASATLAELLRLNSRFSVARYNLSCLHALQGDKTEALKSLTLAMQLNPMWKEFAKGDPDFAGLWKDQDWIDLVYS